MIRMSLVFFFDTYLVLDEIWNSNVDMLGAIDLFSFIFQQ